MIFEHSSVLSLDFALQRQNYMNKYVCQFIIYIPSQVYEGKCSYLTFDIQLK